MELVSAGIAANDAASLDEALAVVVESYVRLTGADGSTVAVWDESRERGVIRAAAGVSRRFLGREFLRGDNIATRAIDAGAPVVLRGETGDGLGGDFAAAVAELACTVAVPLDLEGVPLMTLHTGWAEPPSEEEIRRAVMVLQTLAELAGLGSRARGERTSARDAALVEAVLESVGDGIWVHTAERNLANAAARRMLLLENDASFGPDELSVRDLDGTPIAPENEPGALARRTGLPQRFRNRATRLDGVERVFDGIAAPVITSAGETVGTVMSFRDVTDEHSSVMLRERLLERVFESLPSAVAVFDAPTHKTRWANQAFLELVGLDLDAVVGTRPPFPWWVEGQELIAPDEEVSHLDWIYRRSDGTLIPVGLRLVVLRTERGEAHSIVAIATDRSEQRRLEQQLVQTGKLAAIGELAAGVAHEINNPLFAILGLVEFLLKDADPGSKTADRLGLIQQTGLEIKDIVRALLDFARERTDDLALVALEEVVAQTADVVRRTSAAKGVEIVATYAAETTTVEASASQLKQVLFNLVTNAQQAMPDGGTITLEVARAGDSATVTVSDTGPGLPPEVAARIFDPFFTTKRDGGGTGLGLSVSLGIAQAHGGDLTLVSEPGRGAAFILSLPLALAALEAA